MVVCVLLAEVHCDCNVCTTSGFACSGLNVIRRCNENNEPTGNRTTCVDGFICDVKGECVSETTGTPACNCETCNEDKEFACVAHNKFALCLGEDTPSSMIGECEEGYVCDTSSTHICVPDSNGGSCPLPEPTEPVPCPSAKDDPDGFCQKMAQRKRYPVGTDPQTTCKHYVSCIPRNDAWIGATYICPGSSYFHDNKIGCSTEVPARCSASVRSLSF